MDLAVKYRFFRHLLSGGNDPDSERVYRWHIEERSGPRMRLGLATDRWKRTLDHYVEAARELSASMYNNGFNPYYAVPVDENRELLDGSHRVACAIAAEIMAVPVAPSGRRVWAPPWNRAWFVDHNMPAADLARLDSDWNRLNARRS